MKLFTRSILVGVLAMGATTLMVAQTSEQQDAADRKVTPTQAAAPANTWFEGWYRAKFGRLSPTEEARLKAQRANTSYREETPRQVSAPANTWFEGWYRAKFGRPSPTEEARLNAERANTAYRDATPAQAAVPDNSRFEAWYREGGAVG
jgi:hypothetical protein